MTEKRFVQKGHYLFQHDVIDRCLASFIFEKDCRRIVNMLNDLIEENERLKEELNGDD